jgi:hypothetical protein
MSSRLCQKAKIIGSSFPSVEADWRASALTSSILMVDRMDRINP